MPILNRILNAFRRNRLDEEIAREIEFHIAERADELEQNGMHRADAVRAARRQFGNTTAQQEHTIDMDLNTGVDAIIRNLRLSARSLWRTPVFSITVVLTLAIGIGANSAVFSAIDAVVLKPLAFPDGDQLMEIRQGNGSLPNTAPQRLEDWNKLSSAFQSITGYYVDDVSELSGDLPQRLKRAYVAPRFFQVFGIAPVIGRDFSPQEERFGGPPAVVISNHYWQSRFSSDPSVIGKRLRIGASAMTVVGVMPMTFRFGERGVDIFAPSPVDAPYAQSREATWYTAIGRLRPGFSIAQAQADMTTVQANLGRQYPKTDQDIRLVVAPYKNSIVGKSGHSLWLLYGSVCLLLLIACTNIAALLLARTSQRSREIALRFSLGASRPSIVFQLLTESFLLAAGGALLGLALAAASTELIRSQAGDLPRADEIRLNWTVMLYSLATVAITTLLCGLYPAVRCTGKDTSGAMLETSRTQVAGRSLAQLMLVGIQIAMAVVLLVGAGLLLRSFRELSKVSPGFDPANVHTFRLSANWGETTDRKRLRDRTRLVLSNLESVPGVESSALSLTLPGLPENSKTAFTRVNASAEAGPEMVAETRVVSPRYFSTVRIPLLEGELCRDESGDIPTAVVNRSFVSTYLAGAPAVGQHLKSASLADVRIVGVVGDARELGWNRPPVPTLYGCFAAAQPGAHFLIRTRGDVRGLPEIVRRKMKEVQPSRAIYDSATLESKIDGAFVENRLRTFLLAFFAFTAAALACLGLYGTMSYIVNLRRREIGLRLALGALRPAIVRQFLTQGTVVSSIGTAVGVAAAAMLARILSGWLYGISATDGFTYLAVAALTLAVGMLASLAPALRAARLDPMAALRDE